MNATLHTWAKLLGGEVSGAQVLCPGPGHSAADRSLSVKIGKDGQPVVHSFCGDDPMACKDYVRATLGMAPFKPNGGRKTVATYDFCDPATGQVRYLKERLESADGTKSFFFKPAGRNGSEPLLYGGERLADLAEGQRIFIVEGEGKVDRLRELGPSPSQGIAALLQNGCHRTPLSCAGCMSSCGPMAKGRREIYRQCREVPKRLGCEPPRRPPIRAAKRHKRPRRLQLAWRPR